MKRTFRIARLALPLALLGCIDFDGQTLSFRHDVKNDRLLIFQVYEGIHAADGAASSASKPATGKTAKGKPARPAVHPTDKELEELASVMTGQRTFFFGNWISEYNRASCEEAIAGATSAASKPASAAKPASAPASQPSPAALRQQAAAAALCKQLLASVKITNGKFFLNGAKQLSGYQQVTIDGVSKLIPLLNAWIDATLAADALEKLSPAAQAKLRDFSARRGRWVELSGNELRVRFWDGYDAFIEFRDEVLKKFSRGQIVVNYDEPLVEVIIGRPDNPVTTLIMPASSKPDRKLIEIVRKKYGIEKSVDIDGLRRTFLGLTSR